MAENKQTNKQMNKQHPITKRYIDIQKSIIFPSVYYI